MNYELWVFEYDDSNWEPIDANDLWWAMERECRPGGMPIMFRDEFGQEFWKLCSLLDEDGDFAGAVVRNQQNGFVYTTTDCEEWTPVKVATK